MQVRVASPGEYDRHDDVLRFVATIDKRPISFMIDLGGLITLREALGLKGVEPIQIYHLGGRLLAKVVEQVFAQGGADPRQVYYIDYRAVLQVTGRNNEGDPNYPKRWLG